MISWEIDIIATISGLIGAMWFVYKYYLKPRNELIEKALTSRHKIDKIYTELFPNHGSTLRDAVDRVERSILRVSLKQHVFLQQHDDGYFETDANGECIFVNQRYCHMVRRTESECLGTGWVHNIHPEDRANVSKEWLESVSGKRVFRMRYRFIRNDGTAIEVFGQGSPLLDPHTNKLLGYFGTIKQLTNTNED